MKAVLCPDFSTVTEQPGQPASRIQMAMLEARYGWALRYCRDKRVLELACGAGMGLEPLAKVARLVTAGDLDAANLSLARKAAARLPNVCLDRIDAGDPGFKDASFDVVLLFEAIYYLPDVRRFLAEVRRVLAPGGVLLIVTVNCQWNGFNPSPFHVRYLSAAELNELLREAGFQVHLSAAFPEERAGASPIIGLVRRTASKARLIPRTMRGKAILKRIFYGPLETVPVRLGSLRPPALVPIEAGTPESIRLDRYRVLYAEAIKP